MNLIYNILRKKHGFGTEINMKVVLKNFGTDF